MNQDIILKESEANRTLQIVLMYLKILLFLAYECPRRQKLPDFGGLEKIVGRFAVTLLPGWFSACKCFVGAGSL
jgi:hypothetical protein